MGQVIGFSAATAAGQLPIANRRSGVRTKIVSPDSAGVAMTGPPMSLTASSLNSGPASIT